MNYRFDCEGFVKAEGKVIPIRVMTSCTGIGDRTPLMLNKMEASSQPHAPAALSLRKSLPMSIEWEASWVQE
jgi:hypothetical protein